MDYFLYIFLFVISSTIFYFLMYRPFGWKSDWKIQFRQTLWSNGDEVPLFFIVARTSRASIWSLSREMDCFGLIFLSEIYFELLTNNRNKLPLGTYATQASEKLAMVLLLERMNCLSTEQETIPLGDGYLYVTTQRYPRLPWMKLFLLSLAR